MLKEKINKKNVNLFNIDSNFHKVNSIMNQRLIGLLDYLKASVYFSHYNDKNNNKNGRNLEKFFKNKIFKTNPLSVPSLKHSLNSNLSEKKNKKRYLDIAVNFKNHKLILQKNKYSTPYDLHLKKNNFLNNMVVFSKHIHSESKMEKDLKEKYPKVESLSLSKNIGKNFSLTPQVSRIKKLAIKTDGFTSTYDDKLNKNIKKRMPNNKTYLSFDNYGNIQKLKNNLRKKKMFLYNNNNYKTNNKNINKLKSAKGKNKTATLFRANCYYNKLHLKKISKNLEKYTYLNEDNV